MNLVRQGGTRAEVSCSVGRKVWRPSKERMKQMEQGEEDVDAFLCDLNIPWTISSSVTGKTMSVSFLKPDFIYL